jgi:hypothetical protein
MNSLALTIYHQENTLNGIVMYEPCDVVVLDKLINSKLLKASFNNKTASHHYENEKKQLEEYRKLFHDGKAKIRYNRRGKYGRSNPERALGLFPIRREIRHTLAGKDGVDIDIKNAHPDFKLQICVANGIPCPELTAYVGNRQVYYDQTMKAYNCTEEDAKNLYIVYLNGGKIGAWKYNRKIDAREVHPRYKGTSGLLETPLNDRFQKEQERINVIIANANPDLVEEVRKTKEERGEEKEEEDLYKSICAVYLQEYEIRILEQIVIHCKDKKYIQDDVCVLCADGLILEKRLVLNTDTLLQELTEVVFEKTGFQLTFTSKAMTQGFNAILDDNLKFDHIFNIHTFHNITDRMITHTDDTSELNRLNTELARFTALNQTNAALTKSIVKEHKEIQARRDRAVYYKRKEYFELFHCKFMKPYSFGMKSRTGMEYMNRQSIMQCHENLKESFMETWMKDDTIRMYQTSDFMPFPMQFHSDVFNLFNGLIGEELLVNDNKQVMFIPEERDRTCEIFIKQLWYLSGKNNKVLEYCLNYFAHMVQKPGLKSGTALIVKGAQGIGKNIMFERLVKVLCGEEYLLSTTNIDDIVGKFSSVNQKLMVILDEASGDDTFKNSEHLKSFITSEKVRFERKGISTVMINNVARVIFLTNNDISTKIEKSERRHQAMEGSPDMANNRDYFSKLVDAFDDKEQVKLLYLFFKHRDISNINMEKDRVVTRLYEEMQSVNISSDLKFFMDQVDEIAGNTNYTAKYIYQLYSEWCLPRKKSPMAENSFAKRLNSIENQAFIKKDKQPSNQFYIVDIEKLRLFKSKIQIDYTEVEATDNFPEKYMKVKPEKNKVIESPQIEIQKEEIIQIEKEIKPMDLKQAAKIPYNSKKQKLYN